MRPTLLDTHFNASPLPHLSRSSFPTSPAGPLSNEGHALTPFAEQDLYRLAALALALYRLPATSRKNRRDAGILRLVWDIGATPRDLMMLNVEDLHSDGSMRLTDGSGAPFDLPLPPSTNTVLRLWSEVRGSQPGPLFCSSRGYHQRLTRRGIDSIVRGAPGPCFNYFTSTKLREMARNYGAWLFGRADGTVAQLFDRDPTICRDAARCVALNLAITLDLAVGQAHMIAPATYATLRPQVVDYVAGHLGWLVPASPGQLLSHHRKTTQSGDPGDWLTQAQKSGAASASDPDSPER